MLNICQLDGHPVVPPSWRIWVQCPGSTPSKVFSGEVWVQHVNTILRLTSDLTRYVLTALAGPEKSIKCYPHIPTEKPTYQLVYISMKSGVELSKDARRKGILSI